MTTLMKLGGAVCTAPDTLDAIANAWHATDHADTWVLVHGGGPQLDAALRAVDGEPVKVDGLRVTSPAAAEAVRETLDAVGAEMAEGLTARGVPVRHVRASEKRLHAVPKDSTGLPLGRVGTATDFHVAGLDGPGVLVVSPVGFDAEGPLNVNADEAALAVAKALGVQRLVLATDVPHVLDGDGAPVPFLDPHGVLDLIGSGAARGGMVPKLRNAVLAVESGVHEVTIGTVAAAWDGGGTRVRLVEEPSEPVVAGGAAA